QCVRADSGATCSRGASRVARGELRMETLTPVGKPGWRLQALVVGTLLLVATIVGLLRLDQSSTVYAAGPYLYVQEPCVNVYAQPNASSTLLTQLLAGTEVAGLEKTTLNGKTWQHIQFWGALDGYIDTGSLSPNYAKNPQSVDCVYPG